MLKHLAAGLVVVATIVSSLTAHARTKGTSYSLKFENLDSIEVEKDGQPKRYTFAKSLGDFYLSEYGHLSAGATTRCDPYVGTIRQEVVLKATILSRGPDKLQKPEAAVLRIPADTRVYGRCGEKSNELIAVTFQRANELRIWIRGADDIATQAEKTEAVAESKRLKKIAAHFASAQDALDRRNYPNVRSSIAALKAENLDEAQEKQLESVIENTPKAERPVGGYMRSSSYAETFKKVIGGDISTMTMKTFLALLQDFADGKVQANMSEKFLGPAGAIHQVISELPEKMEIEDQKRLAEILAQIVTQRQKTVVSVTAAAGEVHTGVHMELGKQDADSLAIEWYAETFAKLTHIPEAATAFTNAMLQLEAAVTGSKDVARIIDEERLKKMVGLGLNHMHEHHTVTEDMKALAQRRGYKL